MSNRVKSQTAILISFTTYIEMLRIFVLQII